MNPTKADDVKDLLSYATNQEVTWHLQCPQSEFVYHFSKWNLNANIHSLDLFAKPAEAVANDALLQLKKAEQLPAFIEPQDIKVTVGSDLTKFNETMTPVFKTVEEMSEKLGESYTELSEAAQSFKQKLEKLAESINKINDKAKPPNSVAAAQSVLNHKGINQKVAYPCDCGDYKPGRLEATIRSIIIHLNDVHHWKREKIADWLDTLPEQPIYYPDLRTDDEKIEDAKTDKHPYTIKTYGPLKLGIIPKGAEVTIFDSDGSVNSKLKGNGGKIDVTYDGYKPGYVEVNFPQGGWNTYYFSG